MRKLILKIHLALVGMVLIQLLTKLTLNLGLIIYLDTAIKGGIILSGLYLFFHYLKPFKKINYYFSIYPVSLFALLIAFIFRGFLGLLIISVVLFPFNLNKKLYSQHGVTVYEDGESFMAVCCSYQVKETKLFIFEKYWGSFKNEGQIDFDQVRINKLEKGIELIFPGKYYDEELGQYRMEEKQIQLKKQ